MKVKLLLAFAATMIAVIILGGCTQSSPPGDGTRSAPSADGETQSMAADREIKRTELTDNADFTAELRAEPELVEAGRDATLVFTIRDKKGEITRDLKIVHEKLVHLLIVSDDLAQFDHVHPDKQADGTFRISYRFPNGGVFKLYADFTPQGSPQIVNVFDIGVGGLARAKTPLVADTNLTKTLDGLTFTMKADQPVKARTGTMLDFFVTDAAGKAVTDLQPYLGAMAHFVVISEDTTKFLHVHAIEGEAAETKTSNSSKGRGGSHGDHGDMEMGEKADMEDDVKPAVQAHTEFPAAGLYKLWGQYQRAGKVFTVSFVLNVEQGESDSVQSGEAPPDSVRIDITAGGFEPAEIKLVKGRRARLAFARKDSNNCASEVVFSKLNIRKSLPVGKTTVVEITPTESGELGFSCGMDMLKGKLLVE